MPEPLPLGWAVTGYQSPNDGEFVVEIDAPAGVEVRVYVNDGDVHTGVVPE